jgi:hypothetical protein
MIAGYALGEVQEPGMPATRHAVADAKPGAWGRGACPTQPRVWVHEAAGAPMPFPGPLGNESGLACPECAAIVASAVDAGRDEPKRLRDWFRRD